jgi:F-type H+-transporting ATPase subunit epsilon
VGEGQGGGLAPQRTPMPGDKKLQSVVVTPEKTLFDEWVDFVALPLYDGEAGILPGRMPLIGRLASANCVPRPATL